MVCGSMDSIECTRYSTNHLHYDTDKEVAQEDRGEVRGRRDGGRNFTVPKDTGD